MKTELVTCVKCKKTENELIAEFPENCDDICKTCNLIYQTRPRWARLAVFDPLCRLIWLCEDCSHKYANLIENMQEAILLNFIQPERSKREDSQVCEMRCSEHCGNTVRGK